MSEREAGVERLPEANKDRQLNQGRQTAGDGVDAMFLVKCELLFGLAALEMRASTEKKATPVLMALDEAGNISPPKLPEKLKIGRFRNTPYLLGYQDVLQVKAKNGGETSGKAVLAGLRNQIFLPGIDPDTGAYASTMLGPVTVLSRTEVDAVGTCQLAIAR